MTTGGAQLWSLLRQHGLVTGDIPPAAQPATFWFVRVMLAIGGWLGAVFLLGFVATGLTFIIDSPAASFITGVVVCAVAAAVLRARAQGDFLPHFGFVVSLAGQALMAWGLARGTDAQAAAACGIAIQQTVLFFLVPNALHRVWTSGSAAVALAYALHELSLGPYAPFLLTAAVAWIWLKELELARRASAWRAAGYGLAVAAVGATVAEASVWLGAILGAAVLVATTVILLRREGANAGSPAGRGGLLVSLVLAAAAVKAPGLAPAMVIVVLGFANGNRVFTAFGVVVLLGYLSHYYYSLHATLLEKSALLAATGIALLLARLALGRAWPQVPPEVSHA